MRLKDFQQSIKEYLNAAATVEQEAPSPPAELALLWRMETYKCLPHPGGLLDQPHILMICLDIIHEERAKIEQMKRINQQRQKEWLEEQKRKGNI